MMDRMLLQGKVIPFTTLAQLTETVWQDGTFYEKWLNTRENTEIFVGSWQESTDEIPIEFKGETFQRKRTVSFQSPRILASVTTPDKLPTQVTVTVQEEQYYRATGQQVVVMTQVQQSNIPFGETFAVQWRWVATDNPTSRRVVVQAGFSMEFYAEVLLAERLRQQQEDFSAARQLDLYRAMKQEMANLQLPLSLKDPWHGLVSVLRVFFPFFAPGKNVTTVPRMIAKVLEQLRLIELMPAPLEMSETLKEDLQKLSEARDALTALCEKEKEWVLSTIADEEVKVMKEKETDSSPPEDLPPFLVPIKDAIGKLNVKNPFDNKTSLKHVLSETDNTVILLPYMDSMLDKMILLASKTIFHCTTKDVLKLLTSPNDDWYKTWMTGSGRTEVNVEQWTTEATKDEFSGEEFTHSRTVTCRFNRSTYNKSAESSASSVTALQTQKQFLRYDEEHSALVFGTTTTVDGMAFSDCWKTHVRWVVSAVEEDAVQVKIGYELELVKPVMVEPMLRSTALEETKRRQIDLMCALRSTNEKYHRKHPVVETVEASVTDAVDKMRRLVRFYPENMLRDDSTWEPVFRDFRKKLGLLEKILRRTGSFVEKEAVQEEARQVFIELDQIRSALEAIVASMGDAEESTDALKEACFSPEKNPTK